MIEGASSHFILQKSIYKSLNISIVTSYIISVPKHSLKITDVIVSYNSQSSFMS